MYTYIVIASQHDPHSTRTNLTSHKILQTLCFPRRGTGTFHDKDSQISPAVVLFPENTSVPWSWPMPQKILVDQLLKKTSERMKTHPPCGPGMPKSWTSESGFRLSCFDMVRTAKHLAHTELFKFWKGTKSSRFFQDIKITRVPPCTKKCVSCDFSTIVFA